MRSLVASLLVATLFGVGLCRDDEDNTGSTDTENQLVFKLTSGLNIPLVGYGIGNLPHEDIPQVIDAQLRAGVLLIDTAHASNNEHLIAEAVAKYDSIEETHSQTRGGAGQPAVAETLAPLHVVTKVWYTHLGYERTKFSIRESLANLNSASPRQIYVHMLLHWPRCNDDIEWMNCEEEENKLPQSVKDLGPPPHLDKNMFKESWKAMEDTYVEHQSEISRRYVEGLHPKHQKKRELLQSRNGETVNPILASIGVSNFDLEDMEELMLSKLPPQIYQGSSWSVFHDPYLMDLLHEHHTFVQSYAVMSGILQRRDQAPNAYNDLSGLSRELMAMVHSEGRDAVISEGTVVLAYFLRMEVGVIPRAASPAHQQENSTPALSAVLSHLNSARIEQLERAIPSLLKGEDLLIKASFMNALTIPIEIHWLHPVTNEEHLVSGVIQPGSVEMHNTHPGHRFVAYDPERAIRKEFLVDARYGENQHFSIEL